MVSVKAFVDKVLRAYLDIIKGSPVPPWFDAFYTVVSLTEIDQSLDELLSDDMAYRIAVLGMFYYPTIKEIWDSFNNEEKIEAINGILSGIASHGLKELLKSAAVGILKWGSPRRRQKVIEAGKELLKGRIDFDVFIYKVIEALEPVPEEYEEKGLSARDIWKGASLSDYVSEEKLKRIVKEDFLDVLEVYGSEGQAGPY